jgi:hypothetical protein
MAALVLADGVQRIGTYIGSTNFTLNGSAYAVGTTRISSLTSAGAPVAWRSGSGFNNLTVLAPGTAFIVLPTGGAVTTDDTLFSFNAPIEGKVVNSNQFVF